MHKPVFSLCWIVLMAVFLAPPPAVACYWDKDTYRAEKRRFPQTLDLLTGKFLRHSDAFYAWRIKDREKIVAEGRPALSTLDDLAVALDKAGRHAEAIQTMSEALLRDENRYETHANLGTFYLHAGDFDTGLKHIKKALAINPQAHFGREIVQQYLVEYVIAQRGGGRMGLPLYMGGAPKESCRPPFEQVAQRLEHWERVKEMAPGKPWLCPWGQYFGFTAFVVSKGLDPKAAVKGVLGMMRFSNHTHPILLEVLGDLLLLKREIHSDAKRLAARAYLAASYRVPGPKVKALYRAKAVLALVGHRKMNLTKVEQSFKRELERGKKYFEVIEAKERRWIESGKDPEREFERAYPPKKKRNR